MHCSLDDCNILGGEFLIIVDRVSLYTAERESNRLILLFIAYSVLIGIGEVWEHLLYGMSLPTNVTVTSYRKVDGKVWRGGCFTT